MISRSGIYGLGVCHEEVECWEFQSLFSSLSNVSSAHNLCTCPVIDRPFGSNLNYRPFTIKGNCLLHFLWTLASFCYHKSFCHFSHLHLLINFPLKFKIIYSCVITIIIPIIIFDNYKRRPMQFL